MLSQLLQRLRVLFVDPRAYWLEALAQPGGIRELLVPDVLLLAALPAGASLIGAVLATGARLSAVGALGLLLVTALHYALMVALWLALGWLIEFFSEPLGAQRDLAQAMKLSFGAMVPLWIAGVTAVIPIPAVAAVAQVLAVAFGCYLLYLGLPVMNATPSERVIPYVVAVMGVFLVAVLVASPVISCGHGCLTLPAALDARSAIDTLDELLQTSRAS